MWRADARHQHAHGRSGRDSGEREDRRVDHDDVRHGRERSRPAQHLAQGRRAVRAQTEEPLQHRGYSIARVPAPRPEAAVNGLYGASVPGNGRSAEEGRPLLTAAGEVVPLLTPAVRARLDSGVEFLYILLSFSARAGKYLRSCGLRRGDPIRGTRSVELLNGTSGPLSSASVGGNRFGSATCREARIGRPSRSISCRTGGRRWTS